MLSASNLISTFKNVSGVAHASPATWLRVTGADATSFLQGQCTQELRNLKPGQASWALWLNLKGRVQAESLLLRSENDTWWLWNAHGRGESLQTRLEDFIIADDVTVENIGATCAWTQVTLAGPEATAWILSQRGSLPPVGTWVALGDGILFAGRRGQVEIWDWLRPSSSTSPTLPVELGKLDHDALARARIAAGVPAIPLEFGPLDLPQEAGLEDVAISFTKGCYLGQEIMARLHAMGQVRRRLLRVTGLGSAPNAGTVVTAKSTRKRIGEIRVAVGDGHGNWIGLAMVTLLGLGETEHFTLENEHGRTVQLFDTH